MFRVGWGIRHKISRQYYKIIGMLKDSYVVDTKQIIPFNEQESFERHPNKFNISTLKPFDKVLVRDEDTQKWCISFFSHCNGLGTYKYSCINGSGYAYCIPYENNEHLLDTTNDCDDYYKTWEK